MPTFSKQFLSLSSAHQNPICTSPLPHTCYVHNVRTFFDIKFSNICSLRSSIYSENHTN